MLGWVFSRASGPHGWGQDAAEGKNRSCGPGSAGTEKEPKGQEEGSCAGFVSPGWPQATCCKQA